MKDAIDAARSLGDLLQDFVGRVAHRGGHTLTIMNEASVTLHQVILLNRLRDVRRSTVSDLAAILGMSAPSVSQMVDRLHRLHLVTRSEMPDDRRKKQIELTQTGQALLERLAQARSAEFEAGTARLSAALRAELAGLLERAVGHLSRQAEVRLPVDG